MKRSYLHCSCSFFDFHSIKGVKDFIYKLPHELRKTLISTLRLKMKEIKKSYKNLNIE